MKKADIKKLRDQRDWAERQILRAICFAYNCKAEDAKKTLYTYYNVQKEIDKQENAGANINSLRAIRDLREDQILAAVSKSYNWRITGCRNLLYAYYDAQKQIDKVINTKTAIEELKERKPKAYTVEQPKKVVFDPDEVVVATDDVPDHYCEGKHGLCTQWDADCNKCKYNI